MSQIYTFKTGKSAGKSLEQLAVENYEELVWLSKNSRLPDSWKKRINEIIYALDNFTSKINCALCEKPAKYISIIPYTLNDISISGEFVYCSKEHAYNDEKTSAIYEGKAQLYKIKYSEIFNAFRRYSKSVKKQIHRVLYNLLAGSMIKTKENLYNLINDIIKSNDPQQHLF